MRELVLISSEEEMWLPAPGFENTHEVSNLGRVRSIDRMRKGKNGFLCGIKGRVLAQRRDNYRRRDYMSVVIQIGGKGRRTTVHRLIAKAFIPNSENKPQVNHKNGIKNDNRVENLEWVTASENIRHAFATGLNRGFPGEESASHKLKDSDISKIKKLASEGIRKSEIAERFNVCYGTIAGIVYNRARKTHKEIITTIDDRSTRTKQSIIRQLQTARILGSYSAPKRVKQYSSNTREFLGEYDSVIEAERVTGVSRKSIRNSNNSKKPSCNYIWQIES